MLMSPFASGLEVEKKSPIPASAAKNIAAPNLKIIVFRI